MSESFQQPVKYYYHSSQSQHRLIHAVKGAVFTSTGEATNDTHFEGGDPSCGMPVS